MWSADISPSKFQQSLKTKDTTRQRRSSTSPHFQACAWGQARRQRDSHMLPPARILASTANNWPGARSRTGNRPGKVLSLPLLQPCHPGIPCPCTRSSSWAGHKDPDPCHVWHRGRGGQRDPCRRCFGWDLVHAPETPSSLYVATDNSFTLQLAGEEPAGRARWRRQAAGLAAATQRTNTRNTNARQQNRSSRTLLRHLAC